MFDCYDRHNLPVRLAHPLEATYVTGIRASELPETSVALTKIQQLMKENEVATIRERRSSDRKHFVRPIVIAAGRNHDILHDAFSRDISSNGIGIVTRNDWTVGTRARLTIHSLSKRLVLISAEVRWCEEFGTGWYVSGWNFLGEEG